MRWISLLATVIASRTRSATVPVSRSRRARSMPHRDVRGLAAGRLPAHTVDDDEQAAGDVDVEPILVDLALQAGMRVAGRSHRADGLHDALTVAARRETLHPDERRDEADEQRQHQESRPEKPRHHPTLRNSRKTVSARPIRATSGSAVSAPFSRLVPLLSSNPRGTWRPFSVVPSVLRSIRKNAPVSGSRRMRTCSRDTSGEAVDANVDWIGDAAAADRDGILRHVKGVIARTRPDKRSVRAPAATRCPRCSVCSRARGPLSGGVNRRDSAGTLADAKIGPRRQDQLGIDEQVAFVHLAVRIGQETPPASRRSRCGTYGPAAPAAEPAEQTPHRRSAIQSAPALRPARAASVPAESG